MPVGDVTTDQVLKVLSPIWTEKTETAKRLQGRIERVLDYATTKGHREGETPLAGEDIWTMCCPSRARFTAWSTSGRYRKRRLPPSQRN